MSSANREVPVVRRGDDGRMVLTEPPHLAGREVLDGIDAQVCNEPDPRGWGICGLIRNHNGKHWSCAPELVDQSGPFALRRARRAP